MMDIGKSFSFPFEDKQWISKLGLGAVITLVPILNFAWNGYLVGIIRNVENDVAEPLPNWDDLGKKIMDGLILFGAGLIYALPALIVLCLPLSIMAFSGVLSSGGDNLQSAAEAIASAGGILLACLSCALVIYAFALSIIYPAILVNFSREGTFASCFKFRDVFDIISKNSGPFLTAWGISLVAGLGVGLVVGLVNALVAWIPCIGWVISIVLSLGSSVYVAAVYGHLFGQFGKAVFGQNQSAPMIEG